jgi:hypothetical protein
VSFYSHYSTLAGRPSRKLRYGIWNIQIIGKWNCPPKCFSNHVQHFCIHDHLLQCEKLVKTALLEREESPLLKCWMLYYDCHLKPTMSPSLPRLEMPLVALIAPCHWNPFKALRKKLVLYMKTISWCKVNSIFGVLQLSYVFMCLAFWTPTSFNNGIIIFGIRSILINNGDSNSSNCIMMRAPTSLPEGMQESIVMKLNSRCKKNSSHGPYGSL